MWIQNTKEFIKINNTYFYLHFLQSVAALKTWEILYIVIRQVPSEQKMGEGCLVQLLSTLNISSLLTIKQIDRKIILLVPFY